MLFNQNILNTSLKIYYSKQQTQLSIITQQNHREQTLTHIEWMIQHISCDN